MGIFLRVLFIALMLLLLHTIVTFSYSILDSSSLTKVSAVTLSMSQLNGKDRRFLRSIAGRMKTENNLSVVDSATYPLTPNNFQGLKQSLKLKELVQVKFRQIKKKAEAKTAGIALAESLECELVQVVGHSVLLYQPLASHADHTSTKVGYVTQELNALRASINNSNAQDADDNGDDDDAE